MKLFPHQEKAVNSILDAPSRRTVAALPCGFGKSLVQAEICCQNPDQRFLCVVDSARLVRQNYYEYLGHSPFNDAGVFSASFANRKEGDARVVFATIGSLRDVGQLGAFDTVFIDECDKVPPLGHENKLYPRMISALIDANPGTRFVGLTATPFRATDGLIYGKDGMPFETCCVNMCSESHYEHFFANHYLARLSYPTVDDLIDVTNVGIDRKSFDYNRSELELASNIDAVNIPAIEAALELAADRRCWLAFCAGIKHAEATAELMNKMGITATWIASKGMNMRERNRRIELLEKGEVRCLVNSDIATVGFNVKKIDAMLILRKVLSIRLHQQMLGRGVRLNFAKGYDLHDDEQRFMAALEGGKENCLVLDFAGNLKTLGPIQEPFDDSFSDPSEVKKKSARMRDCPTCKIKVKPVDSFCLDCGYYFEPDPGVACPSCEKVVAANSRFCRFCEHPFIEINQNPTTNMELDDKTPDEAVYNVRYASFKYHEPKNGGAPGIMVNVFCYSGQKLFFWLSYKNNGASYFARESWKILSNVQRGAPRTIGEARARINELKCPKRLKVKEKGKFKTIVGADHG